ncbi:MAG: hypothetical protein QW075_04675 [Thermofilaceae archaeon]
MRVYSETAEGYPECFTRLASKEVLPESLAFRLASAARLRPPRPQVLGYR